MQRRFLLASSSSAFFFPRRPFLGGGGAAKPSCACVFASPAASILALAIVVARRLWGFQWRGAAAGTEPQFLSAALISNVLVLSAALSVVVQRWWSCQHGVPPVQSATGTSRRPVHGGRAAGVNAICRDVIGCGTGLSARGPTRWGYAGESTSKAAGQAGYATGTGEAFLKTRDISQCRQPDGPHCGDVTVGLDLSARPLHCGINCRCSTATQHDPDVLQLSLLKHSKLEIPLINVARSSSLGVSGANPGKSNHPITPNESSRSNQELVSKYQKSSTASRLSLNPIQVADIPKTLRPK